MKTVFSTFAVFLMLFGAAPSSALIPNVTSPTDICVATADPCVIADTVEVVSGTVLDFGSRTVRVDPGGVIDIGAGSVTILCGGFVVATGNAVGILARGADGFGGFDGGVLTVEARGTCAGSPSTLCVGDGDCSSGPCVVGSAVIDLDGQVRGTGELAADLSFSAAGDVTVRRSIDIGGASPSADGGELWLESGTGTLRIVGNLGLGGGSAAAGGRTFLTAALDISVTATIDAQGGDFDGGSIDLDAGRDVVIGAPLLAGSIAGTGSGGDVVVVAGRDVIVSGSGEIDADGNQSISGEFAGDGGRQDIAAGGVVTVRKGGSLHANGGVPDGFGGSVSVTAVGNTLISGLLEAKAPGARGSGGSVEVSAGGRLDLRSGSLIDVTGGSAGGGLATLDSGAYLSMAGVIDGSTAGGGTPAQIAVTAAGSADFAGTIRDSGVASSGGSGQVQIEGCDVTFVSGAVLQNDAVPARTAITSHEQLTVEAGGQIVATAGTGTNTFVYRSAAKAPVINGVVTPAPALVVNGQLAACGVCGNSTIEVGETCDDGNPAWLPGQFCNGFCTVIGCGDPDDSGSRTATDALFVLKTAVGAASCDACVCDVDNRGGASPVTATDALRLLRVAVGQAVVLTCPVCML